MARDIFVQSKETKGRNLAVEYLSYCIVFTFTEDKFNNVDFFGQSTTKGKNYVGDIKAYTNPKRPRPSTKYSNYQIDYDKLRHIKKEALNKKMTPLLVVFFTDKLVVWDLTNIPWEDRHKWVLVSKDDDNDYEEKEIELQTYLYFPEACYSIDLNQNNDGKYIK